MCSATPNKMQLIKKISSDISIAKTVTIAAAASNNKITEARTSPPTKLLNKIKSKQLLNNKNLSISRPILNNYDQDLDDYVLVKKIIVLLLINLLKILILICSIVHKMPRHCSLLLQILCKSSSQINNYNLMEKSLYR